MSERQSSTHLDSSELREQLSKLHARFGEFRGRL
jgi:hypothetical protein